MTDDSGKNGESGDIEASRRLARLLIESRERGTALDLGRLAEEHLEPASDVDANSVDDLVAKLSARPVRGWKVGC